jgi:hypothetical protein
VLSIVGICVPLLWLVGIGLSIAGLTKTHPRGSRSGQGLAIAGIAIGALGLFFNGVMAAIAIPNFIKFQSRAKQAECWANLRSAYEAEMAYRAEQNAFTDDFAVLGFRPERGNRYAYFAAEVGAFEDRSDLLPRQPKKIAGFAVDRIKFKDADPRLDAPVPVPGVAVGLTGTCPDCSITIACAGNIDSDDTLDLWTVSTQERQAPDGTRIPAGVPYNDVNDVER